MMIAQNYAGRGQAVAKHLGWPETKVQAAFNYAKAFPDEINSAIAENDAVDLQSLSRALPQAKEFVVGRRRGSKP
jgi:hypothetical protein